MHFASPQWYSCDRANCGRTLIWTRRSGLSNSRNATHPISRLSRRDDIDDYLIVPLSLRAVKILRATHAFTGDDVYVFPGARDRHRPMSENAILAAMRRMGIPKGQMCGSWFSCNSTDNLKAGTQNPRRSNRTPTRASGDRSQWPCIQSRNIFSRAALNNATLGRLPRQIEITEGGSVHKAQASHRWTELPSHSCQESG